MIVSIALASYHGLMADAFNTIRDKAKPASRTLWLILLAGACIRIFQIGRESLWYDELYTIWSSRLPLDVLVWEVPASGHPPLYYLAGHVWFALGEGEAWFRTISFLAGVATIWLVYLLGTELFSRRVALWAAAIAAVSPYLVWYSRDATDYAWLIAVSTASVYLLVRGINRGGWMNWVGYVLATVAALFSHYYASVLLIAELPVFFILPGWRPQIKSWLVCQAAIGMSLGPWLLYNRSAAAWAGTRIPGLKNIAEVIGAAPFVLIRGYANTLGSGTLTVGLTTIKIIVLVSTILFITALLFASASIRRALYGRRLLALGIYTFLMISGPAVLQLVRGEAVAGRYYAMAAPGLILIVAVAISAVPPRLGLISGTMLMAGLLGVLYFQHFHTHNADWRGIMTTIVENGRPGDVVECFPLHNCVTAQSIYNENLPLYGGLIDYADNNAFYIPSSQLGWTGYREGYGGDGPSQLSSISGDELKQRLADDTVNAKRLWLISGSGAIGQYPSGKGVELALGNDWANIESWSFESLSLKLYERK